MVNVIVALFSISQSPSLCRPMSRTTDRLMMIRQCTEVPSLFQSRSIFISKRFAAFVAFFTFLSLGNRMRPCFECFVRLLFCAVHLYHFVDNSFIVLSL